MTKMTPSYSLGLLFILLVALIWSVASMVVQYLYTDQHFDSPFLLTYIGTSLFVLLLPTRLLWERRCCFRDEEEQKIPWKSTSKSQYERLESTEAISLQNVQMEISPHPVEEMWSHADHFRVALKIAPVWFVANWAYNASLAYTSITSSTVLASTGSLFTFLFAVLYKDEGFALVKLLGVLLGVAGSIVTGLHDVHDNGDASNTMTNSTLSTAPGHAGMAHHVTSSADTWQGHAIWGDGLGLLSAVGYGAYAVMIRIQCPKDESLMSMQLLLGYIGLVNATLLSPLVIYTLVGSSTHGLTWMVFGFLVLKGLFDNVLSDYLWARAVVLTSATVATVGLGLTIPLAFASDWIMGHSSVSISSVLGALAVLAGFVLVNVGNKDVDEEEAEEEQVDIG